MMKLTKIPTYQDNSPVVDEYLRSTRSIIPHLETEILRNLALHLAMTTSTLNPNPNSSFNGILTVSPAPIDRDFVLFLVPYMLKALSVLVVSSSVDARSVYQDFTAQERSFYVREKLVAPDDIARFLPSRGNHLFGNHLDLESQLAEKKYELVVADVDKCNIHSIYAGQFDLIIVTNANNFSGQMWHEINTHFAMNRKIFMLNETPQWCPIKNPIVSFLKPKNEY